MSEEWLRQQAIQSRCFHPSGQWIEFKETDIDKSIAELFEAQVRQRPDKVAVKTAKDQLTYAELNTAANQIARAVLATGRRQSETIALCFELGTHLIAAMVAVVKLGKCQVVLDPSNSRERNADLLADSQAEIILTHQQTLDVVCAYASEEHHILNFSELDLNSDAENLMLQIPAETPLRLMYTSGSTGRPKGVIQTHQILLYDLMKVINAAHLSNADKCLYHSTTSFLPVFRVLLCGATIYPFNTKRESFAALSQWMIQEKITFLQTVPTVLHHFTNTLDGDLSFSHLRLIVLGGEALYRKQVEQFRRRFPEAILINALGSIESFYYRLYFLDQHSTIQEDRVPSGYALPNYEVLLLDDANQVVSAGEVGQIVVKSQYLSAGYWRRPDLTATKFMDDPAGGAERLYFTGDLGQLMPDGLLLYRGRKDFQVKIRGFRVEIDLVETALRNLSAITGAIVKPHEDHTGALCLVAYVTSQEMVTASVLRRQLASTLPDYMIPSTFVFMDAFPRTSLGKIDRQALPPPTSARPSLDSPYVAPRTPVEVEVASIWADVLGVDEVGVQDLFLDLGGHSLQATQIVTRVLNAFQVALPPHILLGTASVASMTNLLLQHHLESLPTDEREGLLTNFEQISDSEANTGRNQALNEAAI
jgi:amino acid adenylation domain-containing protein